MAWEFRFGVLGSHTSGATRATSPVRIRAMSVSRNDTLVAPQTQPPVPTVALPPRTPPNKRSKAEQTTVQCSRCLNTMEILPLRVRTRLRCTKCHRSLRLPKTIKQVCPYCKSHSDFSTEASGRRMKCRSCGVRLQIPVQVARPRKRHRRATRTPRQQGSVFPLMVALGIAILGLMLCFRIFSNL